MHRLFWLRDKREGLGRRREFREGVAGLLREDGGVARWKHVFPFIPYYGNWKDLVVIAALAPESVREIALLFAIQLYQDLASEGRVSTAAKWFPGSRSKEGKSVLAVMVRQLMGLSNEGEMRKLVLSPLRRRLGVVEVKMSEGRWAEIGGKLTEGGERRYRMAMVRRGYDDHKKRLSISLKLPLSDRQPPSPSQLISQYPFARSY